MSILRRVFQRFLKPTYFVGRDLEGNKYYEHPNANDGRPKRTVQYRRTDDMWTYIASNRRLPVQWTTWLTHTRPNPPTIEELQADLVRQQRVRMNAAVLEARDRGERDRTARLAQASHSQVTEPHLENLSETVPSGSPVNTPSGSPSPVCRDRTRPWAEANKGSGEPRSPIVHRK